METIIKTKYGYSVPCYGPIDDTMTLFLCFDNGLYDGCSTEGFETWKQAVSEIAEFAERNGIILEQLESDS
jgi:hypothetical protein